MRLTVSRSAALVAAALVFSGASPAYAAKSCREAAESAQDLRGAGKLKDARAQLQVCAQRTCKDAIRNDCEKWLREIDEQTPSIIVRAVDANGKDVLGARVTIDDAPIELDGNPVQVDPGPRTVRVRTKSGDSAEQKVLVALAEKNRLIEVRLKEAPAEKPPPTDAKDTKPVEPQADGSNVVPITLAAVGGVALVSFVVFEVLAQSGFSDLENGCAKSNAGCTDAEIDPVRTQFVAAGVSLGISVLALGAAAIVYLTRKPVSTATFRGPVITF